MSIFDMKLFFGCLLFCLEMCAIHCNSVEQMFSQISNYSFSSKFDLIQDYMREVEDIFEGSPDKNLKDRVSFWLYTRDNPVKSQVLLVDHSETIADSNFSPHKKTVVLVHGWLNAGNAPFSKMIKNAYLRAHDYNIICVDWSSLAYSLIYPIARFSIKYIGQYIALMLETIVNTVDYNITDVHLVGHSLGAHVCGIVGENIKEGQIGRITGLDPAGPLFGYDITGRLDPTDAKFVDIIHTCGLFLGYFEPCGHVDFYPNGGRPIQPGCGFDIGLCSHRRSYIYFTESIITQTGFSAHKCGSWRDYQEGKCTKTEMQPMGEYVNLKAVGNYYLLTANSEPYALGKFLPLEGTVPQDSRKFTERLLDYTNTVGKLFSMKVKTFGDLANNVYSWFV